MNRFQAALSVLGILFCLTPLPSSACSPVVNYLKPSNYELVKSTYAIVLAEVLKFEPSAAGPGQSTVLFQVEHVLKGPFTGNTLADQWGYDAFYGRSEAGGFTKARPGAYKGSCIAHDYRVGHRYLLFLEMRDDAWKISGPPFTRVNEEVDGLDSPWVVAISEYIRIASLDEYEREKDALRILQVQVSERKDPKRYPAAIMADLDDHFSTPSQYKSFDDLMEMYTKASSEKQRSRVLWAFYNGKHPEARTLMRQLLAQGDLGPSGQVAAYLGRVEDSTSVDSLIRVYLAPASRARPEWQNGWQPWIIQALLATANESHKTRMLEVFKAADDWAAGRLAQWFARYPSPDALAALRDRRDRIDLTSRDQIIYALAGAGDPELVKWADRMLSDTNEATRFKRRWIEETKSRHADWDEHMLGHLDGFADIQSRILPIVIIARSPLPAADASARKLISDGGVPLVTLVGGYKDSFNPNRWERLEEIIRSTTKSPELIAEIRRTLKSIASSEPMGFPEMQAEQDRARARSLLMLLR